MQLKIQFPEDNISKKLIITNTPWPTLLPNGTEVVKISPRSGMEHKQWFKRADGKLLFEGELDGKFYLLNGEYEEVK